MTNYGQPGGGHPGSWRGQRPDETPGRPVQQPYPPVPETYPPAVPSYPPAPQGHPGPYGGPPTPPYGAAPGAPYGGGAGTPYGGSYQPSPAGPAYGGQPYRPDEPYGEDPAPGRRGRGPLIAVLAVVLLVVAVAGAFSFRRGQSDPTPAAAPSSSAVAGEPSADAVAPAPSAAAPESSADPRFAKVGQCVRNDGTAGGKPKLLISGCTAKSYEVLSRIDGPTSGERDAEAKCGKVEGYTNWYFFDSELDTLDFVLCLKQR
ncbi:flagellar basal body protein FliL [Micromonospora ureilytica]|uniref:Flagellar basal body protein FliL n=1 Tax=Micromonospora ureilytica TaxID=709868 RepID=A0A3N9XVP3_9ACTN|nr:flagellar basal body protein FliL [Micromonospora ureilytica]